MDLPEMPPGPAWLGWILFAVVLLLWIARQVTGARSESASTTKTQLESQLIRLNLLKESAAIQSAQLRAVADALSSDSPARPSLEALGGLTRRPDEAHQSIVAHLISREHARTELPRIVTKLDRIHAHRLAIEQAVAAGLTDNEDTIAQLRTELRGVGQSIAELIREIAESPRVYLADAAPLDAVEGDVWIAIGHQGVGQGATDSSDDASY